VRMRCGWRSWPAQIRCTERKLIPVVCHGTAAPGGRGAGRLGASEHHHPPDHRVAQGCLAGLAGQRHKAIASSGLVERVALSFPAIKKGDAAGDKVCAQGLVSLLTEPGSEAEPVWSIYARPPMHSRAHLRSDRSR
jgi:hypothetical protein